MMRALIGVALGFLCVAGTLAASGPLLVEAASTGDLGAVRSLLKGGADPNEAAPDGSTALHWAVHRDRSEEHTSELQSQSNLVCRLLLEKKNKQKSKTLNTL